MQGSSRDFVQEGANLVRLQSTPTKSRKLLGFFVTSINFTFLFYTFYFSIPVSRGGHAPPPLATFLLMGVSIPEKVITA